MHFNLFRAETALAASLMLEPASAFWRMSCPSRLLDERVDPVVQPGVVSGHMHSISGGSGFGFTMNYTQARASACSTCEIKEDLSNYWTPKLYYQAQDGTFTVVPQSGDGTGSLGGMVVYYEQRDGPNHDQLKAFPAGFRMVAGNPFKRSPTNDLASQAVQWVCLDYNGGSSNSRIIPNKNCPDGLRAQIYFPSCWDGVNLDTSDHKSHMSYPIGHYDTGACPSGFPVHLISIFYEVIFNIDVFKDKWYGTNHPFVLAQGDPTGAGFHGDFVNGWDINVLQSATDNCNDNGGSVQACPYFTTFTGDECQACKIPNVVKEDYVGPLAQLPGCNPVTPGPQDATPPQSCNVQPAIKSADAYVTDLTSSGWKYLGCATDSTGTRTLSGSRKLDSTMTLEKCVAFCKSGGFTYAGAEYASQCYCGNSLPAANAPKTGVYGRCNMACGGNSNEICGGPSALSLYQTCTGSDCQNLKWPFAGPYPPGPAAKRELEEVFNRRHAKDFSLNGSL